MMTIRSIEIIATVVVISIGGTFFAQSVTTAEPDRTLFGLERGELISVLTLIVGLLTTMWNSNRMAKLAIDRATAESKLQAEKAATDHSHQLELLKLQHAQEVADRKEKYESERRERLELAELTSRKIEENTVLTTAVKDQVAIVKADVEVVSGHVNSAATAAKAEITALREEVRRLVGERAETKNTADLLAQSNAIAKATHSTPEEMAPPLEAVSLAKDPVVQDILASIDDNTAATAENTKSNTTALKQNTQELKDKKHE